MTQNTKQKLIKHFNLLKIMGYEYHEPVDLHLTKNDESIVLPDTIDTLKELVDNCSLCELNKYTKKKFFSKGNLTSKVMIIGDFPSSDNYDPFAGQSGKMLVAMCQNVLKLDPNDVYYTTILKCNVPLSQAVHNDNINCCKDYFIKQIEIIKPLVIIVFDTQTYKHLNTLNIFDKQNIVITHSPSFLLRNPSSKKASFARFRKS